MRADATARAMYGEKREYYKDFKNMTLQGIESQFTLEQKKVFLKIANSIKILGNDDQKIFEVTQLINQNKKPKNLDDSIWNQASRVLQEGRQVQIQATTEVQVPIYNTTAIPVLVVPIICASIVMGKKALNALKNFELPNMPEFDLGLPGVGNVSYSLGERINFKAKEKPTKAKIYKIKPFENVQDDKYIADYIGSHYGNLQKLLQMPRSNESIIQDGLDLQGVLNQYTDQIAELYSQTFSTQEEVDSEVHTLVFNISNAMREQYLRFVANRDSNTNTIRLGETEKRIYYFNTTLNDNKSYLDGVEEYQFKNRAKLFFNEVIVQIEKQGILPLRLRNLRKRVSESFSSNKYQRPNN
jgi:hypothetical protein